MYETKISDKKWILYDIPGNIGWILFYIGIYNLLFKMFNYIYLIGLIPTIMIFIGLCELINERIKKLDRILPRIRFFRGFGLITYGSYIGIICSIIFLIISINQYAIMALIGSILCSIFCTLIYKSYKLKEN